mmetsp:Transcript_34574/g.42285  ORF Transcript_34574/g.42285 Transcript_34574/m.42285 type:complete len:493 (-) Transcript_34574:134-1612(-)
MFRNAPDDEWDDLHADTSRKGLNKILELRGFYIKSGQLCAANIGNAFPKVWQDTMSVLQDECPPKDFSVVKRVIESEMGRPLNDVFQSMETTPIGAASIGQVHRAVLRNGDEVVVKVMYPEVESLFRGDVRTIKMFAQVAQPVHVPALNEVEKQFMTEFDYAKEARQMLKIKENLTRAGLVGEGKTFYVPRPYLDLCSKRVLVMEELKGPKLQVGLRKNMENLATKMGFGSIEELQQRMIQNEGLLPKQGPSAQEMDKYINLLESKQQVEHWAKTLFNYTLGWLPGVQPKGNKDKEDGEDTVVLLNHARIVDDLLLIHGHEVLVDGYFNNDPHPGNILLLNGSEDKVKGKHHQLGLIDYGQVKQLSKHDRLLLCQLVIALADDNEKEVVRLMKEAGYKSRDMNEKIIHRYAKVSYDEDNDELTEGMHIQLFVEELQRRDPIEALPVDFIAVGRTSILLRGLGHALNQSRSVARAWRPIAEQVLKEEADLDAS